MAQVTEWSVNIGYYDGSAPGSSLVLSDLTNRTLGIHIDQQTDPGRLGTGTASITLNNADGELTPGGSGTYASIDWLTHGLFLDVTVDGTEVGVFHGIITDFTLTDDGQNNSAVTIQALDVFQVVGRQQSTIYSLTATNTAYVLYHLTSPTLMGNTTKVPTLGLNAMRTYWHELNDPSSDVEHNIPVGSEYVLGDLINNSVMPNAQTVAWPTILDTTQQIFSNDAWIGFTCDGLARSGTYSSGNVFEFTDVTPLPAGDLPFKRLVRDFHIDLITNAATVTAIDGGTAQTHTDEASQERYGTRARSYQTTSVDNAQALYTAQLWVNRYSYDETFDMSASQFTVTDAMIQATGADLSKWRDLLDVTEGWWQTGSVRYVPGGGTARTDPFVIAGRTIEAGPQDTTVTLKVRPQSVYLAFILDDPVRGVLGQNKLG